MKVICFGDSNTFGYDPASRAGEPYGPDTRWVDILARNTGWNVVNEGVNGREIPTEPVAFPGDTDFLIVMLGTNDLLQLSMPEDAAERMEAFLRSVNLPAEKILLIAPPVMKPGAWVQDPGLIEDCVTLARLFRQAAGSCGVRFLDAGDWDIGLSYDGVHFSEEGSRRFGELLSAQLCGILGSRERDCAITVDYMRRCDEATIATTTPSLDLMYRAAEGVFHAMQNRFGALRGNLSILAGSGNNGGDGFALACVLFRRTGLVSTVYTLSDKLSGDSRHYAEQYAEMTRHAGVFIKPFDPEHNNLQICDYVVDCMLGTGFQGNLRKNYRDAIEQFNRCPAFKISVDINSGMNGDTGEGERMVQSDLTVAIGFVKQGQVKPGAGRVMKRLVCADIGIRHLPSREGFPIDGGISWYDGSSSFECPMKNYIGTITGDAMSELNPLGRE